MPVSPKNLRALIQHKEEYLVKNWQEIIDDELSKNFDGTNPVSIQVDKYPTQRVLSLLEEIYLQHKWKLETEYSHTDYYFKLTPLE